MREERVVELAEFLQAELCDVGTVPGQCGHALEIESGALVEQETLERRVRLEEGNPGWHANEERSEEFEACERGKRRGPRIENRIIKVTTVVDPE